MSTSQAELFWLIFIGTLAIVVLVTMIVASIIVYNRKLLRTQNEKLEEIKNREKIYSDLFNNIPDLAYVHSLDGKILRVNSTFEKILGFELAELIGQSLKNIFASEFNEAENYFNHLLDKENSSGIFHIRSSNGSVYAFEYKNSIVQENGRPTAIRGIARDVTEKIKIDKELKQKDSLLQAVADATNELLVTYDYKQSINAFLKILGTATGVDRVYIFENHIHPETNEPSTSQKFEWCKEGVIPQIDNELLQNLPFSDPQAKPLYEKISKGEVYGGIVRTLSQPEQEILSSQEILSVIILPIKIGDKLWGFIGFDDCTNEREWKDAEESILLAAAASIGGLMGLIEVENRLINTNLFLKSILESSSSIAIMTSDLDGRIEYWNSGAEKIFGIAASEAIGRIGRELYLPKDEPKQLEKLLELREILINKKQAVNSEFRCLRKDKSKFWLNTTISPLLDDSNNVSGFCSIGEDIDERKTAEISLKQSEELFRTVWENSADGMRLLDGSGRIVMVNAAYCDLVQVPAQKLIGKFFNFPYKDSQPEHIDVFQNRFITETFLSRQSVSITLHNGRKVPVELTNSFIRFGKDKKLLLSIFRNMTPHKKAETEIKKSREELRNLSAHLQTIREEERASISREIHDELGQFLTAFNLDLSWIEGMVSNKQRKLKERIKEMSNLINSTIETVQRISTDLRPALLDDLGLIPAIEWQIDEFQKRTGIICKVNIDLFENDFGQEYSTTVFRILQETLTNIARHSQAKNVKITISKKYGNLFLKVEDDGKGIPKESIIDPKSFGLIGMQERASIFEGTVNISSSKGKGTTVTLKIPLINAEEETID